MDLYLRKSDQGQLGPEIYRVILKDDGDEVEVGSINLPARKRAADSGYRTLMLPLDCRHYTAVTALAAAFFMAMAHGRPDAEDDG